jgi:hypothetical protein
MIRVLPDPISSAQSAEFYMFFKRCYWLLLKHFREGESSVTPSSDPDAAGPIER